MECLVSILTIGLLLPSFTGSMPKQKVTMHCGQVAMQVLLRMCKTPKPEVKELCNHPVIKSINIFCNGTKPYSPELSESLQASKDSDLLSNIDTKDQMISDSDGIQQLVSRSEEKPFYRLMLNDVNEFLAEAEKEEGSSA